LKAGFAAVPEQREAGVALEGAKMKSASRPAMDLHQLRSISARLAFHRHSSRER